MTALIPGVAPARIRTSPSLGRRARLDAVVRTVAGAALWLSLLLVTYWWVGRRRHPGPRRLGDRADLARPADRPGRLGPAARPGAADGAACRCWSAPSARTGSRALHRLVGFTSFNLMLAHIVLITWGYAAGELLATPGHAVEPDRRLPRHAARRRRHASCLVMVVVTSVKAARRRLRYESWHLLHLYAYLGVGLALPHQLWTGQQFLVLAGRAPSSGGRRGRVAAGAVLVWRVGAAAVAQPAAPAAGHLGRAARATASCRST